MGVKLRDLLGKGKVEQLLGSPSLLHLIEDLLELSGIAASVAFQARLNVVIVAANIMVRT